MKWKCKRPLFTVALIFSLLTVSMGFAVEIPGMPEHYVVDLADMIESGVEQRLNGYLQELEQKTGAQMIVLTIESLEGASIEDFSITVAHDKWRLGQAGEDNGLLLTVSVGDRKYRIEVGYGLEGTLPDSFVGEVGRNYMVPYFKKGDYGTGIFSAAVVLVNAIAKEYDVAITGMPKIKRPSRYVSRKKTSGPFSKLFSILFVIFLIYMFIRHPRAFLTMLLLSSMGNRSSHWGGGGGGGGFGSFGGGGGGGFGGGGASGGW